MKESSSLRSGTQIEAGMPTERRSTRSNDAVRFWEALRKRRHHGGRPTRRMMDLTAIATGKAQFIDVRSIKMDRSDHD
jgi:hypothetical protein